MRPTRFRFPILLRFLVALLCCAAAQRPLSAQLSWAQRHQAGGTGEFLWSIVEGDAGIVAVGTRGKILHSIDGRNWARRDSGTTDWLVAVTYGIGRYIAVGESGTILYSTDAVTWTRASDSGTRERLNNVQFGHDRFIAVGENSTILTSADGSSWRLVRFTISPPAVWLRGLAHARVNSAGIWIATGQNGFIATSGDGATWMPYDSERGFPGQPRVDLEAVVPVGPGSYAGLPQARFFAVGAGGTVCEIDAGLALTASFGPARRNAGTTARLRSLGYMNGVLVATGENGTIVSAPSTEGPWSRIDVGTTKNIVGNGFVQGTLLLVGEDETILQSMPVFPSRLGNVSTRGTAGSADNSMIVGTVIQGPRAKRLLVRGVGPSLTQFGVQDALSEVTLRVYGPHGTLVAENSRWNTPPNSNIELMSRLVGAFPLPFNSRDAGLDLTLAPGNYTFELSSDSGAVGSALIEAYDLDSPATAVSRAINLSTRGRVGAGGDGLLTAGIVVQGNSSRRLLIRGVGPTLTQFGVEGALADPAVKVLAQDGAVIASNDDWTTSTVVGGRTVTADDLRNAAAVAGAFPFASGSKDAALLVTLLPGNYTVQVSSANHAAGVALVEAYEVPSSFEFIPDTPLDRSFDLGPALNLAPACAVEQPDGKIIIGGQFSFSVEGRTQFALARLHRDGSVDTSFRPARIDSASSVSALALQADGRILIGGNFSTVDGLARPRLARLNSDGSLDSTFLVGTTANTPEIQQILVDPEGRIYILAGSALRFLPDGTRDTSWIGAFYSFYFGSGAQVSVQSGALRRIALRPDGRLAAAVSINTPAIPLVNVPARRHDILVVYNPNGSLPAEYANTWSNGPFYSPIIDLRILENNRAVIGTAPAGLTLSSLAIAGDGGIWVAGSFRTPRFNLAYYRPDGALSAYTLTTGFTDRTGASAPPLRLLPLQDGSLLALGSFVRIDGVLRPHVARFRAPD